MKELETVRKSAPEFSFYHKVCAFFEDDPNIEIGEIDEENYEFTITVYNDRRKYNVLKQALCIPKSAARLTVNFDYADEIDELGVSEKDLAYLLKDNKYFSCYVEPDEYVDEYEEDENGLLPGKMKYVMMKPTVVQYYDDIFNNPFGYDTKTAEALAKELFHGSRCNITTDSVDECDYDYDI